MQERHQVLFALVWTLTVARLTTPKIRQFRDTFDNRVMSYITFYHSQLKLFSVMCSRLELVRGFGLTNLMLYRRVLIVIELMFRLRMLIAFFLKNYDFITPDVLHFFFILTLAIVKLLYFRLYTAFYTRFSVTYHIRLQQHVQL